MTISNGYFVYDLLAMWYLRILDGSMIIHHGIVIVSLTVGCATGNAGDILCGAIFLTEISNPAMHSRMVLKHLGLRYTKAYELSEITYMSNYPLYHSNFDNSPLYDWPCCPWPSCSLSYLGLHCQQLDC